MNESKRSLLAADVREVPEHEDREQRLQPIRKQHMENRSGCKSADKSEQRSRKGLPRKKGKRRSPRLTLVQGQDRPQIQWTCYLKKRVRKSKKRKKAEGGEKKKKLYPELRAVLKARPSLGEDVSAAAKYVGFTPGYGESLSLESGSLVALEMSFCQESCAYVVGKAEVVGDGIGGGRKDGTIIEAGDVMRAYNGHVLIGAADEEEGGLHFASPHNLLKVLRKTTWPCVLTLESKTSGKEYEVRVLM